MRVWLELGVGGWGRSEMGDGWRTAANEANGGMQRVEDGEDGTVADEREGQ